ncbi:MAG TPA: helix-turn-helix transcriptional regulator [Tepidisphaeraceae bacterium]
MPLYRRPVLSSMGIGSHAKRVNRTCLPGLWSIHLYPYAADLELDGHRFPIRPGYAGVVPPGGTTTWWFRGESPAAYCHLRFDGNPRPEDGVSVGPDRVSVPAMQDLGPAFEHLDETIRRAIALAATQPDRAMVKVWDLLWELTDPHPTGSTHRQAGAGQANPPAHPALRAAQAMIALRLAEPLDVHNIAKAAGVSPTHLTRLFRAATGCGVAQYVRSRRMERARHLLLHSTMPIKSVAVEVGICDLQLFNKIVRRYLGRSPREMRDFPIVSDPSAGTP